MLGIISNELYKYYTSKSVIRMYMIVAVVIVLMNALLPVSVETSLLVPGVHALSSFGALYGIFVAFVSGKIWENDMGNGVIINIYSSGISRSRYYFSKVITTVFQALTLTVVVSAADFIGGLIKSHGEFGELALVMVNTNLLSFGILFAMTIGESFIVNAIMHLLSPFRLALIVSVIVMFLEYLINMLWLSKIAFIVTPVGAFFKTINYTYETFRAVAVQAGIVSVIYIAIFGAVTFILCKKEEF